MWYNITGDIHTQYSKYLRFKLDGLQHEILPSNFITQLECSVWRHDGDVLANTQIPHL